MPWLWTWPPRQRKTKTRSSRLTTFWIYNCHYTENVKLITLILREWRITLFSLFPVVFLTRKYLFEQLIDLMSWCIYIMLQAEPDLPNKRRPDSECTPTMIPDLPLNVYESFCPTVMMNFSYLTHDNMYWNVPWSSTVPVWEKYCPGVWH